MSEEINGQVHAAESKKTPKASSSVSLDFPAACILPLGDSITQLSDVQWSYRYPLWKKLVAAGVDFDFIGSTQERKNKKGFKPYPPDDFDKDHEGHWGWTTDELLKELPNWLENYTPDIVLFQSGANDNRKGQSPKSTIKEMAEVTVQLRKKNPNVTIFVSLMTPTTKSSLYPAQVPKVNALITELVKEQNTMQSPIYLVDQYSGFNVAEDTYDTVHPNEKGEEKYASKLFEALMQHWPKSTTKACSKK